MRLGQALLARGATVVAFDPVSLETGVALISGGAPDAHIEAAPSVADACAGAEAVVVATEWPEFAALDWAALAPTMAGTVVIDGRRIVDTATATAAGLRVLALGVEVSGAALLPVE